MKIVAISDTHNLHRKFIKGSHKLPKGDMLLHCGDYSCKGTQQEYESFLKWFRALPYKYKIFISGNHDRYSLDPFIEKDVIYLKDSMVDIEGIRIYGSPIHNLAKWPYAVDKYTGGIPECDILMTHGGAKGVCPSNDTLDIGTPNLSQVYRKRMKYHFFGHDHNANSRIQIMNQTTCINCAIHTWLWRDLPNNVPYTINYEQNN